ncbi:MAG: hypothetical protein AAB276_09500, partial [Pseudomonadota bacterium]
MNIEKFNKAFGRKFMNQKNLSVFLSSVFFVAASVNEALAEKALPDPVHKRTYSFSTAIMPSGGSVPDDVDFDGRGPHNLWISQTGADLFFDTEIGGFDKMCRVWVWAISRKTKEITTLLYENRRNYFYKSRLNVDVPKTISFEGVNYTFTLKRCDVNWNGGKRIDDNVSMEITQDLSNLPEYKAVKARQEMKPEEYASSIQVRWDDKSRKEVLLGRGTYDLTPRVPMQVGT